VHLARRLGEVECRDCGTIVPPAAEAEPLAEVAAGEAAGPPGGPSADLSEEVARALDRVLGRGLVSQSAPRTGADTR
jgi:hypothetical protein